MYFVENTQSEMCIQHLRENTCVFSANYMYFHFPCILPNIFDDNGVTRLFPAIVDKPSGGNTLAIYNTGPSCGGCGGTGGEERGLGW